MENFIIYFEKVISAEDIEEAEKEGYKIQEKLGLQEWEMTARATNRKSN